MAGLTPPPPNPGKWTGQASIPEYESRTVQVAANPSGPVELGQGPTRPEGDVLSFSPNVSLDAANAPNNSRISSSESSGADGLLAGVADKAQCVEK